MEIDIFLLLKLICDVGLFVLIWMVQLIVYPGFRFYSKDDLLKWHDPYTKSITVIVMPLMLGQLLLSLMLFYSNLWSIFETIDLVLVLLTWISTFTIFVPLHHNISVSKKVEDSTRKLIFLNWIRTLLWSFVVILTIIKIL